MTDDAKPGLVAPTYWLARGPTYVKVSTALSHDLSDHEKLGVKPGARLTGQLVKETEDYLIVSDMTIDGELVPPDLNFVYKHHWTPVPDHPARIEAPAVSPAAASLEDRIRARSYELWELDGRPDARSDYYWHRASSEVAYALEKTKKPAT